MDNTLHTCVDIASEYLQGCNTGVGVKSHGFCSLHQCKCATYTMFLIKFLLSNSVSAAITKIDWQHAVFIFMVNLSFYGWSFFLWLVFPLMLFPYRVFCNRQHMLELLQQFPFCVATTKLLQSLHFLRFSCKNTVRRASPSYILS